MILRRNNPIGIVDMESIIECMFIKKVSCNMILQMITPKIFKDE